MSNTTTSRASSLLDEDDMSVGDLAKHVQSLTDRITVDGNKLERITKDDGKAYFRLPGEEDALVEKTKQYSGKDSLSPDEYYQIKQLLNDPDQLNQVSASSVSYLILGNYGDDGDFSKKDRLKLVRLALNERDPGAYAFLMEEIDEAWGNEFITKFRILSDRVDNIVGVFEDDAGGNANESGIIVTEPYRSRKFILKREYETIEENRAAYNTMQANIFTIIERTSGLSLWEDRFELVEKAMDLPTEPPV